MLHLSGMGFLLHMLTLELPSLPIIGLADLRELLGRFTHIFTEPTTFPPTRTHDHQISAVAEQPTHECEALLVSLLPKE